MAEWFKCPVALVDSDELTGSEKLVMLSLLRHMGQNDVCWPSVETIAKEAGLKRRRAVDIISELQRKGLLEVSQRRGTSSLYKITDAMIAQVGMQSLHKGSATIAQGVCNDCTGGMQSLHPNYINRNRYKKQIKEIEEPRPKFRGQSQDPDRMPSWSDVMPAWAERMGLTEETEDDDSERLDRF